MEDTLPGPPEDHPYEGVEGAPDSDPVGKVENFSDPESEEQKKSRISAGLWMKLLFIHVDLSSRRQYFKLIQCGLKFCHLGFQLI